MTPDYLNDLFAAPSVIRALSSKAMVKNMIDVERAYLEVMGGDAQAYVDFTPDIKALTNATARDGVVVPELVAQMRAFFDHPLIHKGMTSQDVMDTAYAMAFVQINAEFGQLIDAGIEKLNNISLKFGERPIMARTRMQAALEVPAFHRLNTWRHGLEELRASLLVLRPEIERISLGGPVGDGRDWENPKETAKKLAKSLGLSNQPYVWHALRGSIQDYGNWLAKLTGHIAKIGQDIALMAQQGVDEIKLMSGGGSSAMAHKSNPVCAEVLVSLGCYNAGLRGTLVQAVIHEQERSGVAWTLEWLVLPQMLRSAETSIRTLVILLENIKHIGKST